MPLNMLEFVSYTEHILRILYSEGTLSEPLNILNITIYE